MPDCTRSAICWVAADAARVFAVVGFPDAAVQEAHERARSVLRKSGVIFPATRITINLAGSGEVKADVAEG